MRLPKIPPNADRRWVKDLPDQAIAEILDNLHDCLGGALRFSLKDEYWTRHARPLTAWPAEPATPTHVAKGLAFTAYCGFRARPSGSEIEVWSAAWFDHNHAQQVGPHDPTHQPTRVLTSENAVDLECACGWRSESGPPNYWRSSETYWWPQRVVDGQAYYLVCPWRSARLCTLADPRHAPRKFTDDFLEACICGWDYYMSAKRPRLVAIDRGLTLADHDEADDGEIEE